MDITLRKHERSHFPIVSIWVFGVIPGCRGVRSCLSQFATAKTQRSGGGHQDWNVLESASWGLSPSPPGHPPLGKSWAGYRKWPVPRYILNSGSLELNQSTEKYRGILNYYKILFVYISLTYRYFSVDAAPPKTPQATTSNDLQAPNHGAFMLWVICYSCTWKFDPCERFSIFSLLSW